MMEKILRKFFLFSTFLFFAQISFAQDPHFTQFFASPLTLNPAFTGLFQGDVRIAANYRNQWASIASPFVTGTLSADFDIMDGRIPYNDRWGVGALALYDKEAGGGLKTNYFAASTAYHKGLDYEGLRSLAVGVQVAYGQKRLNFDKLVFEDQLTNTGFDQNIPSGEVFERTAVSYPDVNVGLLYNESVGTYGNYYVGASYYHSTHPNQSFLGGFKTPLRSRWTVHGGGGWAPTPKTRVYLSGLYMQQAGATEAAIGGAFGMVFNNNPLDADVFYLGAWVRPGDAVNPYVGVEVKSVHFGLSYDINTSSLHAASDYRGGFELSFIYIFSKNTKQIINCPKF